MGRTGPEQSAKTLEKTQVSKQGAVKSAALPGKVSDQKGQSEHFAAARLAVIAELLADLPQAERQSVIADLPPADPHLQRLIDAWPALPEAVRKGILAIVEATERE